MIQLKRVYDAAEKTDGTRFLVDHLWPRGIKKEALHFESWFKEIAPSDALRKWFNHDLAKWKEFQRRYFAELNEKTEAWKPLLQAAKEHDITLLFASREMEHNNAVALKTFLEKHFRTRKAAVKRTRD